MSTLAQADAASISAFDARHKRLRVYSFVVLAVALFVTGYLSYTHLTRTSIACIGGSSGCDTVTSSVWSRFYGIPVAYLGFTAWVIMGGVLLLETRVKFMREYGTALIFGVALFCFVYHCYLTTVSITLIRATCTWCLTAHTCMTIMLIIASRRLYLSMASPKPAA